MSDTMTILVVGIAAILGYKFLVLDKKGATPPVAPTPVPTTPPPDAVGVPPPPVGGEATPPVTEGGEKPKEDEKKGDSKKKKKSDSKYANAYYRAYYTQDSSLYSLSRLGNCL